MSSPITFSNFNNIDFNVVLSGIMQQESQPLYRLQTQQSALQSQNTAFGTLATKLGAVQTAANDLADASTLTSYTASSTDSTAASATLGTSAVAGQYDVVVQDLARAQVTVSASSAADVDTTTVATGGTLTIGGKDVTLTGAVTLTGLRDAINATADIGVNASIVGDAPGSYRLVLTSKNTGTASAFTIVNNLTGGGVTFTDTNSNGTSGDSPADNAVQATDAKVLVNNILITSATNTISSAIAGATLTVAKKDPTATVTITVAADNSSLKSRINTFVSAYNSLTSWLSTQQTAAAKGDTTSIGLNPLVRTLRSTLSATMLGKYATGGAYNYVTQVGIEFQQDGTMSFDEKAFDTAVANGTTDVSKLFTSAGTGPGAFASLDTVITTYTQSGGLVSSAQTSLTTQISHLSDQITDMQDRLARRRAALKAQFIAADQAMTTLNSQSGSLANLGAKLVQG